MRGRMVVWLLTSAGVLASGAPAMGATLSVDDEGTDCPAAGYASIQAAVDAAASGDTIAICPGEYAEGTGAAGTNALTIAKSLTLKGAGADLVRISPRRTTPTGGQIAEAVPDIRNGVGDVLAVTGTPALPVAVTISGVTVDGDGVFAEAGIVFLDAQGTILRSRVTNVVTTEAANGYFTPGGWRGSHPGYGIAQVTAATVAPAAAAPRTLTIENSRVDRYNRAGVHVAGLALNGTAAVDNRAVLSASDVVGRVLCQNFAADGNCSAPGLVTTGPLFGQDGVQATGRARVSVEGSSVTQNLVNGLGAPERQTYTAAGVPQNPGTTGNVNLTLAAGIRLVDADAAASSITRTNIVDNAYGAINVTADGTTPNPVPVPAENNWWGLRFTPLFVPPTTPPTPPPPSPNLGPAISPTFNPPVPENPVNGAAVTDAQDGGTTSSAVDFKPFRAGAQADPQAGQFANLQAPSPVDDAAPAVALAAVPDGLGLRLEATASDDFGVRAVTFYDGATKLGTAAAPPYAVAYSAPPGAPCAERTFTALVQDSLGQTAAATAAAVVGGGTSCVPPVPQPPVASLPDSLQSIAQGGTTVTVEPVSAAGIAKVEFLLGTRLVCTVTVAPYACSIVPRAADVGLQTLRVVITDRNGLATVLTRQVLIDRFALRGVSVSVSSTRAGAGLRRRTLTARLRLPAGVTAAEACRDGSVTLVVNRRGRAFLNVQPRLRADCSVRLRFTARRSSRRIYSISVRFPGNTVLKPATAFRRFS